MSDKRPKMSDMTNSTKTKEKRARISVQVPPDLRSAMQAAADADGRTLSGWIVRALGAAVKGRR